MSWLKSVSRWCFNVYSGFIVECPVNEVFIMHFIMFQEKKLFRKGVANVFGEGYLR